MCVRAVLLVNAIHTEKSFPHSSLASCGTNYANFVPYMVTRCDERARPGNEAKKWVCNGLEGRSQMKGCCYDKMRGVLY